MVDHLADSILPLDPFRCLLPFCPQTRIIDKLVQFLAKLLLVHVEQAHPVAVASLLHPNAVANLIAHAWENEDGNAEVETLGAERRKLFY